MARKYFTLCTRDDGGWSPQFGDYVRRVVDDERDDYRQRVKAKDIKIITTDGTQAAIDAAVAVLNETERKARIDADFAAADEQEALPTIGIADLVAAVKKHAMNNYNTGGWDFIVECWTDDDIAAAIGSATTAKAAIARVGRTASSLGDRRSDIQNA
jgi:hypothetical protein